MLLGFKENHNKRPTGFPAKILIGGNVQPEEDTYPHFDTAIDEARRKKQRPKIHTLREDLKNRWGAGKVIHFATGVRTPNLKKFAQGICTGKQKVVLSSDGVQVFIRVDERLLSGAEVVQFYQNDGFDTLDDFLAWFQPIVLKEPNREKTYRLIHWTTFRY